MAAKMGTDRIFRKSAAGNEVVKFSGSSGPFFSFQPSAFARCTRRRGQTAIEYLLVTVSLLFVFVTLYRTLQWYLSREFRAGGVIVMKMYKQDPN